MLKLVPFNDAWIDSDRIDLHAIYRRPRFVQDAYGEWSRELDDNGLPTWDLTTALPVKQHNKWMQKGFQYVTLANRDSLLMAARTGTLLGGTARDYDQHQTGGPWNWRKFHEGQQHTNTEELDRLRADVEEFGADTVEKLRRRTHPDFVLPPSLRKPAVKKAEKSDTVKA